MATKTFTSEVDVSLNDFHDFEILDYVMENHWTKSELGQLKDFVLKELKDQAPEEAEYFFPVKTLADIQKYELLLEAFKKFTLPELERRLS